jgi:hypothetical protein
MCTRQVKKGMQGIDAILYEKKGKGEQHTPSSPHCSGFACIMAEVSRSPLVHDHRLPWSFRRHILTGW